MSHRGRSAGATDRGERVRGTNGQRAFRCRGPRSVTLALLIAVGATAVCSGAAAVPGRIAPPRHQITIYPIDFADRDLIVLGEGKVWALRGNDLRPFDLATEPLVGTVGYPGGPVFEDGSLWLLGLDLDRECAPSNFPFRLTQIDPATNSVVKTIDLPGWCRYVNDNRTPHPFIVGGGGAIWITDSNPPSQRSSNVRIVRVDTVTGTVTTAVSGTRVVVAADEGGAWVTTAATIAEGAPSAPSDNNLGLYVPGPIQLDRVDQNGAVVAEDLLPSARFQYPMYSVDGDGLWVTYEKVNPSPTAKKPTVALARVTANGERIAARGVRPWSVATGDGQAWFLTHATGRTGAPTKTKQWVLGRIDPMTGKVRQTIRLRLPVGPPRFPLVEGPVIAKVMGGGVWIDTVIPVGPARQRQLIRVAI